jgi:hypothetical protein
MQRLSLRLLAAFVVLALSGAGFTKKASATANSNSSNRQKSYYWFFAQADWFFDYNTVANEEWEMEADFGGLVDENPTGGLLLDLGYQDDSDDPHDFPPLIFLYQH